jgi:outer membrane protein assembly factor BamB
MVDDLALARPVWKSEAFVPTGYGSAPDSRYFSRAGQTDNGGGSSSPVVVNGRVYQFYYYPRGPVGLDKAYGKYNDETDLAAKAKELFPKREVQQRAVVNHFRTQADEFLVCMDAATGQTLWKTGFPQRGNNYQTHKHRGFFPVPLVADGVVYQPNTTGRLYALDGATGKLLWEYPDANPEPYVAKQGSVDCTAPSPVLIGDIVAFATNKGVIAVDAKSGQKKWEQPIGNRSSLLTWKGPTRTLILATDRKHETKENFTVALDSSDGKIVWRQRIDFLTDFGFPLLSGDLLVAYSVKLDNIKPGVNDGLAVLHAYRVSEGGLEVAWTTPTGAPIVDTVGLAIQGGHVYLTAASETFCFSLVKGERIASAKNVGGARTQTAFAADGRLFLQPEGRHGNQSFFMLEADPKQFKVLGGGSKLADPLSAGKWLPPHSWTTAYANQPIVYPLVDGRLFVRGLDAVYCYDLRVPSSSNGKP